MYISGDQFNLSRLHGHKCAGEGIISQEGGGILDKKLISNFWRASPLGVVLVILQIVVIFTPSN